MFQSFIKKIPWRSENVDAICSRVLRAVCENYLNQVYTHSLRLHTEIVLKVKKKKKKVQYDSVFSGIKKQGGERSIWQCTM